MNDNEDEEARQDEVTDPGPPHMMQGAAGGAADFPQRPEYDSDPGASLVQTHSRYLPNTGFGCALFYARNGFNKLN